MTISEALLDKNKPINRKLKGVTRVVRGKSEKYSAMEDQEVNVVRKKEESILRLGF